MFNLPFSGKNMKRFLQFRVGFHKLPIASGRRTGVARACSACGLCTSSDAGAVRLLVLKVLFSVRVCWIGTIMLI